MEISKETEKGIMKFLKDHKEWNMTREECLEILPLLRKYSGLVIVELEYYVKNPA